MLPDVVLWRSGRFRWTNQHLVTLYPKLCRSVDPRLGNIRSRPNIKFKKNAQPGLYICTKIAWSLARAKESVSEMHACIIGMLWRIPGVISMHKTSLGGFTELALLSVSRPISRSHNLTTFFHTVKMFWAICRVRNDMRRQNWNCKPYFQHQISLPYCLCIVSWK